MNTSSLRPITIQLCFLLVSGAITTASAAGGTKTNTPAKPLEVAKSTFAMPRTKNEGRDPFYPNSSYPYQESGGKIRDGGTTRPATPVDLKLTGIGGTPDNRLCTINGRTFGKGEDGEMTVGGSKVQIHILDILEDSVVLTVNGEQRELRFRRYFQ